MANQDSQPVDATVSQRAEGSPAPQPPVNPTESPIGDALIRISVVSALVVAVALIAFFMLV